VSEAFFEGAGMKMSSFTAGTGDRIHAATLAGFHGCSVDVLGDIITPNGLAMLETGDDEAVRSASNTGDRIAVIVDAAPERATPRWRVIGGIGGFSGFFIINCSGSGRRSALCFD